MKNHELDQYFKKNADERSFEFDESYWSEMETLMDTQEPPKSGFWLWFKNGAIGFSVLLVIGLAVWFLLPQLPASTIHTPHSDKNQTGAASEGNFIPNNDTKITKSDNHSSPNTSGNEWTTHTKNTSDAAFKVNTTTVVTATPSSNAAFKNNRNTDKKSGKGQKEEKENKKSTSNAPEEATDVVENPTAAADRNNKNTAPPKRAENYTSVKEEGSAPPIAQNNPKDEQVVAEWGKITALTTTLLRTSNRKPTALPTYYNPENGTKNTRTKSPIYFGAIVGINNYRGYINMGERRVAVDSRAFAGIYTRMGFKNNWSATLGINYWERNALNSEITADSTVYGFGATTYTRSVTVHHTQNIEVPVMVSRQFGKSSLQMGLYFNYLLNARGTFQQTVSDDFSTQVEDAQTQNGYQTVFNAWDVGGSIGYEYQVMPHLNIGVQMQQGFMDVTKNSVFQNGVTDFNTQLRIYARYQLPIESALKNGRF